MSDLNQGYSATANPGYGAMLNGRDPACAPSEPDRSHLKVHRDLHRDTVAKPLADAAQSNSASTLTGTYPGTSSGGGI